MAAGKLSFFPTYTRTSVWGPASFWSIAGFYRSSPVLIEQTHVLRAAGRTDFPMVMRSLREVGLGPGGGSCALWKQEAQARLWGTASWSP